MRARVIIEMTTVGSDPHLMLTGPIAATKKVLAACRACAVSDDINLFEVNEAFASVPLHLGTGYRRVISKSVNIHGGAIALGASAWAALARDLLTTLINALESDRNTVRLADDVLWWRHGDRDHH